MFYFITRYVIVGIHISYYIICYRKQHKESEIDKGNIIKKIDN